MKTKVIFRDWKGETIALFPDDCGDMSPYTCQSYMHIGQHSAADPLLIIQRSKPATSENARTLAAELRRIGYRLDVRKRYQHTSVNTRRAQIDASHLNTVESATV